MRMQRFDAGALRYRTAQAALAVAVSQSGCGLRRHHGIISIVLPPLALLLVLDRNSAGNAARARPHAMAARFDVAEHAKSPIDWRRCCNAAVRPRAGRCAPRVASWVIGISFHDVGDDGAPAGRLTFQAFHRARTTSRKRRRIT